MAVAGRVLHIYRGDYSPTETYDTLDVVKYDGRSWVCKKSALGQDPVDGEYWQSFTDKIPKATVPTETDEGLFGTVRPDGETISIDEETGNLKVLEGGARIITKQEFEELLRDNPQSMIGKQFAIIDDYEKPEQAGLDNFGFCSISQSENETEINGKVLSATEKNPNVPNSLASKILGFREDIDNSKRDIVEITAELSQNESDGFLATKNKFYGKLKQGSWVYSSGAFQDNSNYVCSAELIEVDPNTEYNFSASVPSGTNLHGVVFYNENKGHEGYNLGSTFTTTANTKYVGINFSKTGGLTPSDVTNVQLEKGTVATSYIKGSGKSNAEITQELSTVVDKVGDCELIESRLIGSGSYTFSIPEKYRNRLLTLSWIYANGKAIDGSYFLIKQGEVIFMTRSSNAKGDLFSLTATTSSISVAAGEWGGQARLRVI